LTDNATFLYVDGKRYWYSTQPTVRKTADDRAGQFDEEAVREEIRKRLEAQARQRAELARVHVAPVGGADVVDEPSARLVILPPGKTHLAESPDSAALGLAREILESRGTGPRIYGNAVVFLAADKARLAELEQAVRYFLAWSSIVADKEVLSLDEFQRRQAETQKAHADQTVALRIPETFQWLLITEQSDPKGPVGWKEVRLQGQDALAVRASRKMIAEEDLFLAMGGSRLRLEIDRVPLWRAEGAHVGVRQLVADFAQYTYLPRARDASVLTAAIEDGVNTTAWEIDGFAIADGWDEEKKRYRGLKAGRAVSVSVNAEALVVKAEVARAQMDAEVPPEPKPGGAGVPGPAGPEGPAEPPPKKITRFHGTVPVDPLRAGRDAGRIADEVIKHLSGLVGARVDVTLEVHAAVPEGIPEDRQRIVNENCRTLKFQSFGFEEE
jgi:hypothetical protein